jgi:NADH-quinone oxidoreductase subunit H
MGDIFTLISNLLTNFFANTLHLPEWAVTLLNNLIGAIVAGLFGLVLVVFTIWLERKLIGRLQDRLGPNRTGPYGLLQTVADALKLLTKEDVIPDGADKFVYTIAPILAVASVVLIYAVIPFAPTAIGTDVSIGALYFVSVSSLGPLAILMAGWSSNNKYALLGAFRVVAQLVSYEVPMVLALLTPVILAGSMRMGEIVRSQSVWYIVMLPVPALIFFISSVAEVGRAPFDLLEAESELVAGFNIEYSGMKFGMFFVGEFLHAFTISALTATLFLGGWRGPGAVQFPTLGAIYFILKSFVVYFVVIWLRGTMPRVRIDHLLAFNWKFLVPLALLSVLTIALVDKTGMEFVPGYVAEGGFVETLPRAGVLLLTNLMIFLAAAWFVRGVARREREALMAADSGAL